MKIKILIEILIKILVEIQIEILKGVLIKIVIFLMPVDPCQKFACKLQDCLEAKGYDENQCQKAIEALKDCCLKFREKSGIVCDGFKNLWEKGPESKNANEKK